MNVLILGGARFLGRALVDALAARGDRITLANRGLSEPAGIPGTEHLLLDRSAGYSALAGRSWDAVIDTSGMLPGVVSEAARALAGSTGRYCFVSTISVYRDGVDPLDETSPTVDIPLDLPSEMTPETYGALKVLCERATSEAYGRHALIVRPGLIVGPYDRSDRFTYWVRRVARGGTILAPGRPERTLQFIDVRDLAEWIVAAIASGRSGTFNATGPRSPLTMRAVLDACARIAGSTPRFVWLSDAQLAAAGLGPWMQVPLWIPEGEDAMIRAVDISRAIDAGLTFRPLDETVDATLQWDRTRPQNEPLKAGLSEEREAAALAERV